MGLEKPIGAAQLVTTNYVVLEAIALVQARLGMAAVEGLCQLLDPFVVSLVDCASFAFMRQNGLRTAFTFDRHFAEFGFSAVVAN